MSVVQAKLKDTLLVTGLALIPISLLVFCVPFFHVPESFIGLFMANFVIAFVYLFVLLLNKRNKVEEHKPHYTFLLLILLLISAYSLNREMNVFNTSPLWLSAVLVIIGLNYCIGIFFKQMGLGFQLIYVFLLGAGVVVFLYLAIYLTPLYFISIVGMLVLGIAVHTFVPLLFVIYTVGFVNRVANDKRQYWISFCSGVVAILVVTTSFTIAWKTTNKRINEAYTNALADGADGLPAWIVMAQQIPDSDIAQKILKTNLVYDIPNWNDEGMWGLPNRSLGELEKVHDPLVVIASLFSGTNYLNDEDRIHILKTAFHARHHTEERLWTGKDLRTQNVITSVRIWPEFYLAYTEKIITVFNHSTRRWGNDQQEGIYTFHLPEGAVATSLSLWINGKEEKGILTTKEKADSAYTGIVGVEQRDPSMIHWQEGNRITVRVFPVLANDNRRFKIGITSPLRKTGAKLVYDNIWFEGPDATEADETVRFNLNGRAPGSFVQTALFNNANNTFERTGSYQPQWSYAIKDEGLSNNLFNFNGVGYFVKPTQHQRMPFLTSQVYFDINAAWTKTEFDQLWNDCKHKQVWVYHTELVQLNDRNKDDYFNELVKQRFSLFPFHAIPNTSASLVVSKSGAATPNLSDLERSDFFNQLKQLSEKRQKIRLFHIGQQPSEYLSTLKDYRFFQYETGDIALVQQLLRSQQFITQNENDTEIAIHSAGISIVKTTTPTACTAPDHLMRLFAYNHILKGYGEQGFGAVKEMTPLINEAKEAYVVSPVSSLIVLETQQDYERYGIEDSKSSLKNASLKSKGAVPEPHEWILIVLVAVIAGYLFIKSRI